MSKRRPRGNHVEARMTRALDELAHYEAFKEDILPDLKKDLESGASADDLYRKYHALAAARAITIAAKETDSSRALAAARDILDRVSGKATEKHEIEHKYSKLKDEQLNSLLASQLEELGMSPADAAEADDDSDVRH